MIWDDIVIYITIGIVGGLIAINEARGINEKRGKREELDSYDKWVIGGVAGMLWPVILMGLIVVWIDYFVRRIFRNDTDEE